MRSVAWISALVALASFTAAEVPRRSRQYIARADTPKSTKDCFSRNDEKTFPKVLTFEPLGPLINEAQTGFGKSSLQTPKGLGLVYNKETVNWLVLENQDNWEVLECDAAQFKGKAEAKACGSSKKALYIDGKYNVGAAIGTTQFVGNKDFVVFDFHSFYITTFAATNAKSVTRIEIWSHDGQEAIDHVVDIEDKITPGSRRKIELPSTFKDLSMVFFAVYDRDLGQSQRFALDDMEITEKVYDKSICVNKPLPETRSSPCKPSPTATKTWTANFDETPLTSGTPASLPTAYSEVVFTENYQVWDIQTLRNIRNRPYFPVPLNGPPGGPNYLYSDGSVQITSNTDYEHFGLEGFYILQSWGFAPTDYAIITIVGWRDPLDGSGLPAKVTKEVKITNSPKYPYWSRIQIKDWPELEGGFNRLRYLAIHAEYVDPATNKRVSAPFLLDNVIFNRESGEGTKCRATLPDYQTISFEDGKEITPNAPVPTTYAGFSLHPLSFLATPRSSYPAGSNGYLAATHGTNAALANTSSPLNRFYFDTSSTSTLFDFSSITLTLDLPVNASLSGIRIGIFAHDACGYATSTTPSFHNLPPSAALNWGYYARFFPPTLVPTIGDERDSRRQQYTVRFPWRQLSRIEFDVRLDPENNVWDQVPFWVDELVVRRGGEKSVACGVCRERSPDGSNELIGRMCEAPRVERW